MESIKKLIAEGEHQQQDFKYRIDDQKKIARTLSAFANTDGGRLLIGVKDSGKIAGVNPEEEFYMIKGAAELFCKPVVEFSSRVWQEDMRLVLEIRVDPVAERNIHAKDEDGRWKIYIRRDDHTVLANKIILKVWKLEKSGIEKPSLFKQEELECLKMIAEHGVVTLSKLYRLLGTQKSAIDETLALLIHWNMVKIEFTSEGMFYRLSDHPE